MPSSITVRGLDLCDEVIGKIDFTSYFWLLVTGTMPDRVRRRWPTRCCVPIAEHGLVPSVVATRMTYGAAPEAFHGAVRCRICSVAARLCWAAPR